MRFMPCVRVIPSLVLSLAVALPAWAECQPSPVRLCLDDDPGDRRFEVEVSYATSLAGGRSGEAGAVPLAPVMPEAGIFTFFHPSNPELLVKILDGCEVNLHFWVFVAGATNAGFEVRVLDHEVGTERRYVNPDLEPSVSFTDSRALPCVGVRAPAS